MNGCSGLFLRCENFDVFKKVAQASVLPLLTKLKEAPKQIQNSHIFSHREELILSIQQENKYGNVRASLSALALKPRKWYRFGRDRPEKQARSLARYLRNRLPNERFLVSFVALEQRAPGNISTATSVVTSDSDVTSDRAQLTTDQLIILRGAHSYRSINSTESAHPSIFPKNEDDINAAQTFFKIHLSRLAEIFDAIEANGLTPPKPILEVLYWALALTTHHRRLNALLRLMTNHQPSTKSLNIDLSSPPPYLNFGPAAKIATTEEPSLPDLLIEWIAQLTKTPEYAFTRGQVSAADLVPRTQACTPSEWDATVSDLKRWRERLRADMACAQEETGRMLID